ncbi:MAG: tetratricopeptide repeat protein [candidate division Zixibacteria bacterium]|nr:tetratricopeptide repeat protein [candidate division Zixibacteria bacterium]
MNDNRKYIFPKDFTVLKKLGEGGTAEVFLVQKKGLVNQKALKVFFDDLQTSLLKNELEISEKIDFPGFVRIFGSDSTECGRTFLSMEYCPGPTLESLAGKLNEQQFLSIISSITASLYVLHSAGYVHNDLKPDNVYCPEKFLSGDYSLDESHCLKLSDFSLARPIDNENTQPVTGTVGYMSPEMILKERVTGSSDLFSLGVLAYRLASGILPFESEANDPLEINAKITEAERPSLRGPGSCFSPKVKEIIFSLLEIKAIKRPRSAFELLELLSKAGSPYPFRRAISPRNLLYAGETLNKIDILNRFGKKSFSPGQLEMLDRTTCFEYSPLRLVLEENYTKGSFARLDGSWGWVNSSEDVVKWPIVLTELCLKQIRGSCLSFYRDLFYVAVLHECGAEPDVYNSNPELKKSYRVVNGRLSNQFHRATLYSVYKRLSRRTKGILSGYLIPLIPVGDSTAALMGRLYYNASQYKKAVENILTATQSVNTDFDLKNIIRLLNIALISAKEISDKTYSGRVSYRMAMIQKNAGQLSEAEGTLLETIELFENSPDHEIVADSYKALGDIYKETSEHNSGIRVLHQAQKIYENLGNSLGLSQTLNNLGNIYWVAGQMEKSLEHYEMALEIQRELKSEKEIASSLSNIGSLHAIQGKYKEAVKYLVDSLEIKKRLDDKGEIARTWNNLGVTYLLVGNVKKAINAFERSLEMNTAIGNKVEQLLNYENLAEVSIQAGHLKTALDYLKHCEVLAQVIGDTSHLGMVYQLTGVMLRRMGKYDDAEGKLFEGVKAAEKNNNQYYLLPCHIDLVKLYSDMKEQAKAHKYYELAYKTADNLGDRQAQFHLLLMKYKISGDIEILTKASEILKELNTPREKSLFALSQLEKNIENKVLDDLDGLINQVREFFSEETEDIDIPRAYLALGRMSILREDTKTAEHCFSKAMEVSLRNNLLPEQWQALSKLSELAFEQKDFEKSFKYAKQTIEILKVIASGIENTERAQKLYADNEIIRLLGRIKSLQSILVNKKGTTVSSP